MTPGMHEPHEFDLKYLKSLFEDLKSNYRDQTKEIGKLASQTGEMNVKLENFKTKSVEQDVRLNDHAKRLRGVEIAQAGCDAGTRLDAHGREIHGIWKHVKRFTAFMDLQKGNGGPDTKAVDTHAQKMQHITDLSVYEGVPFRVALLKTLPFFIIAAIFIIAMTTLVLVQVFTGTQVIPDLPKIDVQNK